MKKLITVIAAVLLIAGVHVATFGQTYNTLTGINAGANLTSGSYNTFTGWGAGYYNSSGSYNVFDGYQAGRAASGSELTGSANSFLGYEAGKNCTGADNNIFMGYRSGYTNTTGDRNTFLGTIAGYTNSTGADNTFVGFSAGNLYAGSYNTSLGSYAGAKVTGEGNICVGTNAGYHASYTLSGAGNTIMGNSAGAGITTGVYNIAIGNNAGGNTSTGGNNVFIGKDAGFQNTSGSSNSMIGYQAGYYYAGADVIGNTFLGYQSGYGSTGASTKGGNSFFGYKSGWVVTTGENNTFLGANAGNTITTGTGNVFIGCNVGSNATATNSNMLYIDNSNTNTPLIYGDFSSNEITINGSLKSTGTLKDSDGHAGSSGDVLKSTGTGTDWVSAGSVETDPVFIAHDAFDITGTNISNWNTAYGWGNHATAGYLNSSSTAGGELSGTLSNLTVTKLLGKTISGTPTTGQVLKYNGSAWALTAVGGWEGSGANTVIATGNVGIGAISPVEKLEVAGNVKVTGGVNVVKNIGNVISFESNTGGNQSKWNIHKPVNADKVSFTYEKNGVTNYDILTLTDSGNVCIGANQSNGSKFYVNGTGTASGVPAFDLLIGTDGIASQIKTNKNKVFFVPEIGPLSSSGCNYNSLAQTGDVALIWTDELDTDNKNKYAGLVIAPKTCANKGIRITADGRVGIGTYVHSSQTDIDANYMLAVNGVIGCKDIFVETTKTTWPDYVFEADYKLMPLADLEQYIDTVKHLPNVKSRIEIDTTGNYSVQEMDYKLLEKVEELTLYIIELKKQNDAIKTQNEELRARIEAVENK